MTRTLLTLLTLTACAPSPASIDWTDGDSGQLGSLKFRLADVDAPETGGVGSVNGAKCEAERRKGEAAKAWITQYTDGKRITITLDEGPDKYGRSIVRLSADGQDIAEAGIEYGYLKPWPHDRDKQETKKPGWCR